MLKKTLARVLVVTFFLSMSSVFAEQIDISRISKDKKTVRAFVGDFKNESGQVQISAEDFKKSFENALLNRKAVKFEIVKSVDASDVQISGVIRNYLYSKSDPVNTYASPSGLLLDAATTENYAEMTVDFMVVETKGGHIIWKSPIRDYIEHTMTPEESVPMVSDKVARTFLWKSFGKPK